MSEHRKPTPPSPKVRKNNGEFPSPNEWMNKDDVKQREQQLLNSQNSAYQSQKSKTSGRGKEMSSGRRSVQNNAGIHTDGSAMRNM